MASVYRRKHYKTVRHHEAGIGTVCQRPEANAPGGTRTIPISASKTPICHERGTESGTLDAQNSAQSDPKLARIVAAWPTLPDDVKRAILKALDDHQSQTRK